MMITKRKIAGLFLICVVSFLIFTVMQGKKEQNQAIETLIEKGVVGNVLVIEKVVGISNSNTKPTNDYYYVEYQEYGNGIKVNGHIKECLRNSTIQIACLPYSLVRAQSLPFSLKMLYVPGEDAISHYCSKHKDLAKNLRLCMPKHKKTYPTFSFQIDRVQQQNQ